MIGVSTSNWIAILKVGKPLSSGTIGGRFDGSGSFFPRIFDRSEIFCFSAGKSSSGPVSNLSSALTMSSRAGAAGAWARDGDAAKAANASSRPMSRNAMRISDTPRRSWPGCSCG